jgi:hypothetical protein
MQPEGCKLWTLVKVVHYQCSLIQGLFHFEDKIMRSYWMPSRARLLDITGGRCGFLAAAHSWF